MTNYDDRPEDTVDETGAQLEEEIEKLAQEGDRVEGEIEDARDEVESKEASGELPTGQTEDAVSE